MELHVQVTKKNVYFERCFFFFKMKKSCFSRVRDIQDLVLNANKESDDVISGSTR